MVGSIEFKMSLLRSWTPYWFVVAIDITLLTELNPCTNFHE